LDAAKAGRGPIWARVSHCLKRCLTKVCLLSYLKVAALLAKRLIKQRKHRNDAIVRVIGRNS